MTRNSAPRNMHVTSALSLLIAVAVAAQDAGTFKLPEDLADGASKVTSIMSRSPLGGRNLGYSEGPVGDAEGNLYFTEDNAGSGNIWKVPPAGQPSNFYNGAGMPNGLEFDNAGKLYSAEKGGVAVYDVKTGSSSRKMIAMDPLTSADEVNSGWRVNDLTVASNGGMFFTNHANGNQFFYRNPAGKVKAYTWTNGMAASALPVQIPNGAEYIEEKKMLLVTADGPAKVYRYDVADDGTVSNKKEFASVKEPDGLTVDEKGNVYVASYGDGTVYVYSPEGGTAIGWIKLGNGGGGNTSNCAFGGTDGKTLFITGNGGAYKIPMKVKGRVRPGSVNLLRRGTLDHRARAAKADFAGWTFDGRKVEAKRPAALILTAPIP